MSGARGGNEGGGTLRTRGEGSRVGRADGRGRRLNSVTKSKNDSIGIYIARWVLLGYEAAAKAPTLCVAATGRGGADELAAALDASQVMYGLLRLTQRIDSSTTVKFACVSWLGDAVPPMRRAKLSAVRGAALDAVSPYHTELLNVTSAADVTAAAIMAQLEEGKA